MTTNTTRMIAGLSLALFSLTACGNKDKSNEGMAPDSTAAASTSSGTLSADEVDIEGLEVGRAVGSDGKISDKTDDFRTTDEIIAVVETNDKEAGKELLARWTFGDTDQMVSEQRQTIAMGTDVRTTFRLTKQSAWPVGTYHVRILHNGKEVKSEQFTVK